MWLASGRRGRWFGDKVAEERRISVHIGCTGKRQGKEAPFCHVLPACNVRSGHAAARRNSNISHAISPRHVRAHEAPRPAGAWCAARGWFAVRRSLRGEATHTALPIKEL